MTILSSVHSDDVLVILSFAHTYGVLVMQNMQAG